MGKIYDRIIELKPQTQTDELRCDDGEVEGWQSDSPYDWEPVLRSLLAMDDSWKLLALHHLPDTGRCNAIIRQRDGRLIAFGLYPDLPRYTISPAGLPDVKSACPTGYFLTFLCDEGVLYAVWSPEENGYKWLGREPHPPACEFREEPAPLPPYSFSAGELPVIEVAVEADAEDSIALSDWISGRNPSACPEEKKESFRKEIGNALEKFMVSLKSAGLRFGMCLVKAVYKTKSGDLWKESEAVVAGDEGQLSLKVLGSFSLNGSFVVRLELSRSPYRLEMTGGAVPADWQDVIESVELIVGKDTPNVSPGYISDVVSVNGRERAFLAGYISLDEKDLKFSADTKVLRSAESFGVPEEIDGVAMRLCCLYAADESGRSAMAMSSSAYPMLIESSVCLESPKVLKVTNALSQIPSAGHGLPPVYAFCFDCVMLVSPAADGYRESRRISRDVVVAREAVAPMRDATAFVTRQGVMKVSGTKVSAISDAEASSLALQFDGNSRLAYSYRFDMLLLFRNSEGEGLWYGVRTGKWAPKSIGPVREVSNPYYDWPELYFIADGILGRFDKNDIVGNSSLPAGEGQLAVTTRALKLGSPFGLKKLVEVAAIWPDGKGREIQVMGAYKLSKWYPLGRSVCGKLRLRGSGFRYFKISVEPGKGEKGLLIPLIYCKIQEI